MPKKENFKDQTDEDLKKKLNELVEGLFKLRFRKVTDVVENPAQFKKDRRNIARIKTVLRQRELKAQAKVEKK
ncbi:MAG TPA: 50S ribosomal protein L29 [Planctomycetota bacterium]|jgi:large subunit ribosomal protein L29|nr:50S ribosomal protein L29 [Planctomycetota bacterium]